jgi:hypothetical protein
MRTRWIAKPARMRTNDAPAMVESLLRPPVSWAAERTIAIANAAYAIAARMTATVVSRRLTLAIRTATVAAAASVRRSCQVSALAATNAAPRETSHAATSRQKIVIRFSISPTRPRY